MARYALMVAAILGFLFTAALTNLLSPMLRLFDRRKLKTQPILKRKKPAPVPMGGLAVIAGTAFAVTLVWLGLSLMEPDLLGNSQRAVLRLMLLFACAYGAVGVVDDRLRLFRGRRTPLLVRLALEVLLTMALMYQLMEMGVLSTVTIVPFVGCRDLGVAFYPVACALGALMVETGGTAGTGEGNCTIAGFFTMLMVGIFTALSNGIHLALYACGLGGALLAFLWWDFPPAKITQGRTGGMFVAGSMWALAVAAGWAGLVPLMGGVFLLNAVVQPLQWVWRKLHREWKVTARPLDANLEAMGWSRVRIAWMLGLASFMFAVLAAMQILNGGSLPF